ncbi:BZ3500_MvSof-1268-A1-R1_Chr9g10769 [Microbotryum saponariae]|uniref:BZ3500_MvSof-1268-A1-R1_Chr9g10769 protein n=1 Tax=Microbotryum saponariae TaxID=289078 RepID=A0A2X0N766_9BASI|nr:BZ3501_MvSof-1269-A2-R1_Chr9g10517 [Microbotryum saponariae]SDA00657.1 BZ3500_MvSof-1268-A1-R1_Chr9g10769 [Microbotryum saponariae]
MPTLKPILLVSGLGNGVGIGGACARLFSLDGYRIGLISRPRQDIHDLCTELNGKGGEAKVFSVEGYDHENLERVFKEVRKEWPGSRLKTAVWNTSQWSNIPFLDIKESDIRASTQINIISATAFAQHAVRMFLEKPASEEKEDAVGGEFGKHADYHGCDERDERGVGFRRFRCGQIGVGFFLVSEPLTSDKQPALINSISTHRMISSSLRALSQSIAREFGPQGVHVAFVIVDGTIKTKATTRLFSNRHERSQDGKSWLDDETLALQPGSIAKAYKYLNEQDPSAWTLEMDLRPAKEKF